MSARPGRASAASFGERRHDRLDVHCVDCGREGTAERFSFELGGDTRVAWIRIPPDWWLLEGNLAMEIFNKVASNFGVSATPLRVRCGECSPTRFADLEGGK